MKTFGLEMRAVDEIKLFPGEIIYVILLRLNLRRSAQALSISRYRLFRMRNIENL